MRLELEDIWYSYPGGRAVLKGISLAVAEGEVLGIIGPTGSGKSTLARQMNLLLEPERGRVLIDGEDAGRMDRREIRRRIGLSFQFPEAALFAPTVREDVAFAPRQLGLPEEEVTERTERALAALDASHLAERSIYALSGGEKRRVAIAGVLAMEPEVLVLDEPTAGLDPASRRALISLIGDLAGEGRSVVLISHDVDEVAEVSDRVCLLDDGVVRAFGTPAEVFYANPDFAPATVRTVLHLLESFPHLGRPVRFGETLSVLRDLLEG
ncbi:energy-coupling factor ABC transporter ATP-binding protein [Rubrobacter calidifluminis]|uniref:energy-coupling factor ABC transporter ATP-binding protein n=1 Tax=Rubrobacter calidifluminis TaxID=1392640 RepID=UPI00236142EE|nr:ABC transporter ATP-binding protein [Rubrobacter calidifluminis]